MNGGLQLPKVQREASHSLLACNRLDPWACADLYTVRCGAGCDSVSGAENKSGHVHRTKANNKTVKEDVKMPAKKKGGKKQKPKKQMGPIVTGNKKNSKKKK